MDAEDIPKYVSPLLVPPVMPRAGVVVADDGTEIDYYEVSVRQFEQQVLPPGLPRTNVWGYGPLSAESSAALLIHNAPSLTIEAIAGRPVRVKWVNELVDEDGHYLEHLLPVDPTLHWANPGWRHRRTRRHAVLRDDTRPLLGPGPDGRPRARRRGRRRRE